MTKNSGVPNFFKGLPKLTRGLADSITTKKVKSIKRRS